MNELASAAGTPDRRSVGESAPTREGAAIWLGLSRFSTSAGAALVAGLVALPGATGVSLAFFYFAAWPSEDPVRQVFAAGVAGVGSWILVSLLFLRGYSGVAKADGAAYDELLVRCNSLRARLLAVETFPQESDSSVADVRKASLHEARSLAGEVERGLDPFASERGWSSPLRWLGGAGYISLWRQLHRAEEALLEGEPKEWLYAAAIGDESRLEKAAVDDRAGLLDELRAFLGEPRKRRERSQILADLNKPEARSLLREIRFVLNSYRDDVFQRFVRIRNRMFTTLVYAALVGDGILALAILVLGDGSRNAVAVALTFYLVGALVGLFAELYGASQGERGAVHDYGLAIVRLFTIPVLSGIAAVGGVVITRLGGTVTGSENLTLEQIFSLHTYSFGLIVAAIFGLTPGLLLARLRAETDEYKKTLVQSGPGAPST